MGAPGGRARADPADRRPDEGKGRIRGLEAQRPPARPDRGRDGRRERPRPGWRPGRAAARREGAGGARGDRRVRRVLRRRLPLGDRARPGGQDRAGGRPRLRGADPELGAEPSFPPIVAGAANGALPHAEPGEREIGSGELVVFDMGAELDGYCSDCTRTYATGDPGDEAASSMSWSSGPRRRRSMRSGRGRAARKSTRSRAG